MIVIQNIGGRSRIRSVLALGVALALSSPAYAQQPEPSPGTDETAEATQLDAIIVTGSRIRRAGFDTLEPATVVSREYIDERGLTNIADALNEIPGFGVGITPEGGQATFGVGVNFVDRFGLGSNRTLALVNGRRFVSSNPPTLFGPAAPGIQVDLNVVPTAMVERIENLAIGGAPTYGSDAIAGVVNVILRKDYEGVESGLSYGVTERGDNERYNGYALFGHNFGDGRGNVTFSMSYDKVQGVLQKERDFFAAGYFNTTNPLADVIGAVFPGRSAATDGRYNPDIPYNTGSGDGIPNGVLIRNRRIWTTPFGGLISPVDTGPFRPGSANLIPGGFGPDGETVLAFDSGGSLVPYDPGSAFSAVDASGGDGLNLVEAGQLTSDVERNTFNTTMRWGLTDYVDVFLEGTFYSAKGTELTDQWMYNAPLFGGLSQMIRFPSDHPMLTPQAQATLAELGVSEFNLSKASRDLVTNNASSTTDLGRVVAGLEGSFELGERIFYWEGSYNYGRSDSRFFGTSLDQQKFINALNVTTNAQGQPVCSPTAIPGLVIPGGGTPVADPDCVPLDMFGDGRPSEAARRYVTELTESQALLEQEVFNLNISSTLLELWSGPLLYNIGYERRKESGLFDPGAFLEQGLGRSVPITPLNGEFTTDEFFGEIVLPLVNPDSELPGLKKLELVGKYRTVDNTINDRANTYTYGLQWKPANDLELRGNFTRSIRAPAITELFLPQATSFQFVTGDPCDSRFINGGPNPDARQRNCQAFLDYYGLSSFTSTAAGASIQGISGGNPDLDNERADSITYGFTWAPSFLEGLTVAADYYKIEIESVISNLTATQLASACLDNEDFNVADVPNANSFCSQITRNAPGSSDPGQATTFVSGFVNGRYFDMEAYSAEIRYRFDTERFGQFGVGLLGYFPQELTVDNTGTSPNPAVDEIGTSKRQYQLLGNWQRGNVGLNLSANYQSGAAFNILDTDETRDILRVDSYWLLNGGASYRFNENGQLRLAISNLLDEDPPFPGFGAGIGNYDILGRRYHLAFEWKFY
ncbi:TonB-dependent receptor [Luteimonas sp. SJ-92]|uniref:TonB-dependent receptor n=1 Tax=Luteimonas salinisoli TaxID=2752307 RepID=A0A853J7D2_9GAMM|nr:TonB-dependent receptor [Luteimonas salinisoli]NZA24981.1 TonB-dependent receptor [Luteimonas salinisoli]